MGCNNGACARADTPGHVCRVDVQGGGINIGVNGFRADSKNGRGGIHTRIRRDDHFVATLHAKGPQAQFDGIRAIGQAAAPRCATPRRKGRFKGLYFGSQGKPAAGHDPFCGRFELVMDR